jgi:hypothetical protein
MSSFLRRPAHPLDERQRQLQDRAQALAFRFLAGALALACLYSAIRHGRNATLPAEDVFTLVTLALILDFFYLVRRRATARDGDRPPMLGRRAFSAFGVLAIVFFVPPLIAGVSASDLLVVVPMYAAVVATAALVLAGLEWHRRRDDDAE